MKKLIASIFFVLFISCVYAEELDFAELITENTAIAYFLKNNWTIERHDNGTYEASKKGATFFGEEIFNIYVSYYEGRFMQFIASYYPISTITILNLIGSYMQNVNAEFLNYEILENGERLTYHFQLVNNNDIPIKSEFSLKTINGANILTYLVQL